MDKERKNMVIGESDKIGRMICIEGLDGTGKTTQIGLLTEKIIKCGREVVKVREPGGTELGEGIRNLLLSKRNRMTTRAEVLLFNAARAQLHEEVIEPSLMAGKVVLCDRWAWSTLAYQGALGESEDWLSELTDYATEGRYPDLTFVLHMSVEEAMKRRAGVLDRIESRDQEYFVRVAENYLRIGSYGICRLIAADQSVEEVEQEIFQELINA